MRGKHRDRQILSGTWGSDELQSGKKKSCFPGLIRLFSQKSAHRLAPRRTAAEKAGEKNIDPLRRET